MAAIVQSNVAGKQTSGNISLTLTSATPAGNLVIVGVAVSQWAGAGSTITSVTDNAGNSYTRINSATYDPVATNRIALFYAVAKSSVKLTITGNVTNSPSGSSTLIAAELSGIDASPIDTSDQISMGS